VFLLCRREPPAAGLQLHESESYMGDRLADLLGQFDRGAAGSGGRDAGRQDQIRSAVVHARGVRDQSLRTEEGRVRQIERLQDSQDGRMRREVLGALVAREIGGGRARRPGQLPEGQAAESPQGLQRRAEGSGTMP
jgi:hypothetical protein